MPTRLRELSQSMPTYKRFSFQVGLNGFNALMCHLRRELVTSVPPNSPFNHLTRHRLGVLCALSPSPISEISIAKVVT